MSDIEKLLPCPFYGAEATEITDVHDLEECGNFEYEDCPCELYEDSGNFGYYTIVCSANRGGCGSSSGYFPTKEQAIEAWNKRV